MKPLSYKIHLPTGSHITARNSQELENILNMNVCRVYQSQQIRIEPVWEQSEARPANTSIRQTTNNLHRRMVTHERDCQCADCQPV